MKNINAYSYKLAIVATSLVMAYFASGIASIAQAAELLKAEPVKQESLHSQAQANLALTFSTLTISTSTTKDDAKDLIAMERSQNNSNKDNTVNKAIVIAE